MHSFYCSQRSVLRRVSARVLIFLLLALLGAAPSQAARGSKYWGSRPTISGTPPTSVMAGQNYSFAPTATDRDSRSLAFRISNQPAWARFDGSTGRLSGTPGSAHVGRYADIQIRVTDGRNWAILPAFSITVVEPIASAPSATSPPPATEPPPPAPPPVTEPPPVTAPVNNVPAIFGPPVTGARAGQPYAFRPTATDADGDLLTFFIQGKPGWATFDGSDGTLSGTPGMADVASANSVLISVSDGKATTSLPAFSIAVAPALTSSARVSWQAPTSNVDGSPCTDLAGYRVFYGNVPGQYGQSLQVSSPEITSIVIEGLTSATTWYFSVKAMTAGGTESEYSNEASKAL
jgi:hypothetical protein